MLYLTQLIYLKEGQEDTFNAFEAVAIPLIAKYNGQLLLRMRPSAADIIESGIEIPYELHLVCFDAETDFANFMQDESRKQFLHLKEQSIRTSWLIKGARL